MKSKARQGGLGSVEKRLLLDQIRMEDVTDGWFGRDVDWYYIDDVRLSNCWIGMVMTGWTRWEDDES